MVVVLIMALMVMMTALVSLTPQSFLLQGRQLPGNQQDPRAPLVHSHEPLGES
jgi:hypothetical protein